MKLVGSRLGRQLGYGLLCVGLFFSNHLTAAAVWDSTIDSATMIVVAMAEKADTSISAGATPRGYEGLPAYDGSNRSIAAAEKLARDYAMTEVAAWTIQPLQLRCMVYRVATIEQRDALLLRLQQDRRVRIAQPLQEFQTLNHPAAALPIAPPASDPTSRYNDPYYRLQSAFLAMDVEPAQRLSTGSGVRIAVIDSAVDANHPDLLGRITEQHDLVDGDTKAADLPAREQDHGTEVAGVIAAVANNHLGIVGIAPAAQLLSYRACWTGSAATARCNSFTLALALSAAIQSKANIINLSLGGPADPLLQQLLAHAIGQGRIVVGAVPPDGRLDGFPIAIDGVIAVSSDDDSALPGRVIRAPGRDVLTLQPGGHYSYASGSSLAAAQVSGTIALMLQQRPSLDVASAQSLLLSSQQATGTIDACRALTGLLDKANPACSVGNRNAPQGKSGTTH